MSVRGFEMNAPKNRSNLRTALVLLSIAMAFFFGVIVKRWLLGK
jgi:hypothetical protein